MILAGVVLGLSGIAAKAYHLHRFDDAVTADGKILNQGLNCFLKSTGYERTQVRFPVPGGVHTAWVNRPCWVKPPDWGFGRGAIWIQYDRRDPDRLRVLTDTSDSEAIKILIAAMVVWVAGAFGIRRLFAWEPKAPDPAPSDNAGPV